MVRRNLGLPHRLISKNFNCVIWDKGDRNSLDASLKVIAFFLESISINRLAEFKSEIYSFFEKHKVKPHLLEIIRNHIKYLD